MNPLIIETMAQIRRDEFEAEAAREHLADQLPRRNGVSLTLVMTALLLVLGVVAFAAGWL